MSEKQPKKKKTAGDVVLTVVLIAAICVFCYAGYNLFHIYTDLLPPERCSVMGKNGKWEIHVDEFRKDGSTRTEYLFAGNPPLPVR